MRIRGEVEEGIAVRPQRKKFPLVKDEGGAEPPSAEGMVLLLGSAARPWNSTLSDPGLDPGCEPSIPFPALYTRILTCVRGLGAGVGEGGRLEAWPSSCGPTYGLQVNPTYSLCLRSWKLTCP